MAKPTLPEPNDLWQWLDYNPKTGAFTWKRQPDFSFSHCTRRSSWVAKIWNTNWAGKKAFRPRSHGYWSGTICGHTVYAHRVAVAMMTGEWPTGQVDHINGVRGDNRWENLRVVSQVENSRNAARSSRNSSGVTGVSWNKASKKWAAYIYPSKGKRKFLGNFGSLEDAAKARKTAEKEHGYHPNHNRASTS